MGTNDVDALDDVFDYESVEFLKRREVAKAQLREERQLIQSLKDARESQGLSLEEVAYRMGITMNRLVLIESGNIDPTLSEVGRYASCIDRKVSFILGDV